MEICLSRWCCLLILRYTSCSRLWMVCRLFSSIPHRFVKGYISLSKLWKVISMKLNSLSFDLKFSMVVFCQVGLLSQNGGSIITSSPVPFSDCEILQQEHNVPAETTVVNSYMSNPSVFASNHCFFLFILSLKNSSAARNVVTTSKGTRIWKSTRPCTWSERSTSAHTAMNPSMSRF